MDVDTPDGAHLPPDSGFRKTWRVRNSGACGWPAGTELVFITGDPLPGPQRVPAAATPPGGEVDISVDFTAPMRTGSYESYWRLQAPGQHLFGAVVFLKIVVDPNAEMWVARPLTPSLALPFPTPTYMPTVRAHPTPTVTGVPTAQPLPSPTATHVPTVRPQPTPTLTATPMPTSVPSPAPTATAAVTVSLGIGGESETLALDPRFYAIVDQAYGAGLNLSEVNSLMRESAGQVQLYWFNVAQTTASPLLESLTILDEETRRVHVFRSRDAVNSPVLYNVYESSWQPTMPAMAPACAAVLSPPEGAVFPTESIGQVWCAQSLWNTIGWPRSDAVTAQLALQETQNGLLIEARTAVSPHVYRAAIDLGARIAVVEQVP